MKGTWQTTDEGGGGGALLVILAVIAAAAVAGPVIAALAVAGGVALVAARVHRWRAGGTTRAFPSPALPRAVQAPREPRQVASGQPPALEQHVHHHWHRVTAEDVAAIIRQQQDGQPPG